MDYRRQRARSVAVADVGSAPCVPSGTSPPGQDQGFGAGRLQRTGGCRRSVAEQLLQLGVGEGLGRQDEPVHGDADPGAGAAARKLVALDGRSSRLSRHQVQPTWAFQQSRLAGDLVCARLLPVGETVEIFGGVEPVPLQLLDVTLETLDTFTGKDADPQEMMEILSFRFRPPTLTNGDGEPLADDAVRVPGGNGRWPWFGGPGVGRLGVRQAISYCR